MLRDWEEWSFRSKLEAFQVSQGNSTLRDANRSLLAKAKASLLEVDSGGRQNKRTKKTKIGGDLVTTNSVLLGPNKVDGSKDHVSCIRRHNFIRYVKHNDHAFSQHPDLAAPPPMPWYYLIEYEPSQVCFVLDLVIIRTLQQKQLPPPPPPQPNTKITHDKETEITRNRVAQLKQGRLAGPSRFIRIKESWQHGPPWYRKWFMCECDDGTRGKEACHFLQHDISLFSAADRKLFVGDLSAVDPLFVGTEFLSPYMYFMDDLISSESLGIAADVGDMTFPPFLPSVVPWLVSTKRPLCLSQPGTLTCPFHCARPDHWSAGPPRVYIFRSQSASQLARLSSPQDLFVPPPGLRIPSSVTTRYEQVRGSEEVCTLQASPTTTTTTTYGDYRDQPRPSNTILLLLPLHFRILFLLTQLTAWTRHPSLFFCFIRRLVRLPLSSQPNVCLPALFLSHGRSSNRSRVLRQHFYHLRPHALQHSQVHAGTVLIWGIPPAAFPVFEFARYAFIAADCFARSIPFVLPRQRDYPGRGAFGPTRIINISLGDLDSIIVVRDLLPLETRSLLTIFYDLSATSHH
ncbi:hypothetical protein SODALDRAFT_362581 [Sodiomyces alkalinus F11]|uniref:Uncharacterized protein n=1 Tax=Sodiomyces alkalinus (strain CBS 110278 / VKM F-3762 / F11) TaxID=1314773 RepID=A0A3N2PMU1_SODAK|nr:hypothetical protein SODALDRAFT_362581 [Sodiomyces alkalinus F11]ROT35750.1 hypothetical protein SODALDRAFT_362581 [Sodiomyces alkalinus F11]